MVAVIPRRRECGYCETEFESTDGRRFYCGEACADTANRLSEIGLKYGMTLKEHRTLWVAQGGVCAICQGSESRVGVELLAIDHCHTTGKVRGLLCSNCNRALGLLKDSPGVLRAAAEYLAAHQQ
jgi:hypothetical protein